MTLLVDLVVGWLPFAEDLKDRLLQCIDCNCAIYIFT